MTLYIRYQPCVTNIKRLSTFKIETLLKSEYKRCLSLEAVKTMKHEEEKSVLKNKIKLVYLHYYKRFPVF